MNPIHFILKNKKKEKKPKPSEIKRVSICFVHAISVSYLVLTLHFLLWLCIYFLIRIIFARYVANFRKGEGGGKNRTYYWWGPKTRHRVAILETFIAKTIRPDL